jgi:hypothetical protein
LISCADDDLNDLDDEIEDNFCYYQTIHNMVAKAVERTQADPKTLHEARLRAEWPLWQEAMAHKITMLEQARTWAPIPHPPGKNIVGSKWVFRIKHNADGSIEKYKARVVARGFTQVFGEDYYDTFSPVAKLASFRAVLALAVHHDWEIEMFDFNSAYLNSKLEEDEEIHMQLPPGYEGQGEEDTVL